MLKLERGGLWGRPVTDPAVRRAETEDRARRIVWNARRNAPGHKKESLYSATSRGQSRKPLTSAMRFVDDLIEAKAPWDEIESLAGLLTVYVRQRRQDLETLKAA